MTRAALIIGLGGTGQWVLTYLKKDLLESNDGVMPDTVKLLAFDTMPHASASAAMASVAREREKGKEKEAKVGSITLETNTEFVHLGGNVYDLAQAVKAGNLPHIGSWYQADHWLRTLPQNSFMLASGAGQLRQFGRIALFKDLSSRIQSDIWRRLDVSIGHLATKIEGNQPLEIILVGSFAGGTGSGMFVDLALLARHRAKSVPNLVRGYFVLPRAFDADADDDMLARSFAAWRELNRLMVVSDDFSLPTLVYNSEDETLQLQNIDKKVFDACYLVDGVRGGARIAAEAELGVHPTVADAISALLDDTAGKSYSEWVTTNLAPTYAANPGTPMYSALGTHSYKVPVYYAQQDFSHQLTLHWLNRLLKPVSDDPQEPTRVTRVDSASPYNPMHTGGDEAFTLLDTGQEYEGHSEDPTLVFGRIASVVRGGGANDSNEVERHARGRLGQRRGMGYTWLEEFTDLGNRADIQEVVQTVRTEARLKVTDAAKPGKEIKVPPKDWPAYAERNLPPYVREHYGWRTAAGEESRGKFGDALDLCSNAQLSIFRRGVKLWLLHTLMGGDKSGRLGYAYDLLDGLIAHLKDFDRFMERVQAKRQELNPKLRAEETRNKKRQAMERLARKKWLLGLLDHPRAHTSQVEYLQAEQDVVDVRKDELLHGAVVRTARAMREHCEEVRDELARWIRVLVMGDPATGVEGLYSLLDKQRQSIEQTASYDERLTAVQTRLGEMEYPTADEDAELKRLMEGITWRTEEDASGFRLHLSIRPTGEVPSNMERLTGQERHELRQHLTQRNLEALQGYAYRRFSGLPAGTRVAERLLQIYGTPKALAADIGDRAEPLFERTPGMQGGPAKWAELIRVAMDVDSETLGLINGLVHERRESRGLDPNVRDQDALVDAVGSADKHKCTIVRTDDLVKPELWRAWGECRAAYLRNSKMPPELNHNFPAEANASKWELKYSRRRRQEYRVFHPWVVMLLERPKRLEQFLFSLALEWACLSDDGARTWYELNVPGFDERYGQIFRLTAPSTAPPSIFQGAKAFVLDGKDQSPRSTWRLDYEEIEEALENLEREQGPEAWMAFLRGQMDSGDDPRRPVDEREVVRWLRGRVSELIELRRLQKDWPKGEPADFEQAYTDLADVAALMFEERLATKETVLKRQARKSPSAPPPPPDGDGSGDE